MSAKGKIQAWFAWTVPMNRDSASWCFGCNSRFKLVFWLTSCLKLTFCLISRFKLVFWLISRFKLVFCLYQFPVSNWCFVCISFLFQTGVLAYFLFQERERGRHVYRQTDGQRQREMQRTYFIFRLTNSSIDLSIRGQKQTRHALYNKPLEKYHRQ